MAAVGVLLPPRLPVPPAVRPRARDRGKAGPHATSGCSGLRYVRYLWWTSSRPTE